MHKTRNDMPQKTRVRVEKLLNARLAEAIDLAAQAKQAHWNVKGPNFSALHVLFDKVHEAIGAHVDVLAERITALGGTARGSVQTVARASMLRPYPEDITSGSEHVAALADRLAAFGERVRAAIDAADKLGDAGTADLLTGVSRDVDQQLWLVEAQQQAAG